MDGTLQGRLTGHGCSQRDEEHYNSSSIHASITNDAVIYKMLALMLMANWEIWVIDMNIAFLH